mmetsp:Transcript_21826/g.26688  ORF Transcript_21826/g.26688 Transcript_21826/m.26688 type:complete len:146 (-) Transcript_21826:5-442(-)
MPVERRKNSATEACGFLTYMLSFPIAAAYIAWCCLSDEMLASLGVTYYPPKIVTFYFPAYLVTLGLALPLLYAGLNALSAPTIDSLNLLADGHSREAPPHINSICGGAFLCEKDEIQNEYGSIPEIFDVDVGLINMHVYNNSARV